MSDSPFLKPEEPKQTLFALVDQDHPAVKGAYREGYQKGLTEILDWLQAEFMNPSVKPKSTEYKVYMDIVRAAGEYTREQLKAARAAASPTN